MAAAAARPSGQAPVPATRRPRASRTWRPCRSWPRARRRRSGSSSRSPAASRSPAWASAGRAMGIRGEHRGDAPDGRDHRAGAVRRAAHPGADRAAAGSARGARRRTRACRCSCARRSGWSRTRSRRAFVIVVLTGLDVYLDSYDTIAGAIPLLPEGRAAAWVVTIGSLLVLGRVRERRCRCWVYRRGLHGVARRGRSTRCTWTRRRPGSRVASGRGGSTRARSRWRRRSRFGLLVSSISWALLAAVAAWLRRRGARVARRPRGRAHWAPGWPWCSAPWSSRIDDAGRPGPRGLARARRPRGAAGAGRDLAARRGRHRGPARGVAARCSAACAALPSARGGGARDGRARHRAPARRRRALGARRAAAVPSASRSPVLDAVLGWVAAESRALPPRRGRAAAAAARCGARATSRSVRAGDRSAGDRAVA